MYVHVQYELCLHVGLNRAPPPPPLKVEGCTVGTLEINFKGKLSGYLVVAASLVARPSDTHC